MRKWVDELFVIIMDMLQDSSLLAKRQVRKRLLCTKTCCLTSLALGHRICFFNL